jgi:hypothetical protein
MTRTQTFTRLSPPEATAEVTAALTAEGFTLRSVSSGVGEVGLQRKNYLMTVVNGLEQREGAALALLRNLPDVCSSGTMGRGTVYIYRRFS